MTPEQLRDYVYPGIYGEKRTTESDPVQPYTGSQVHGAMADLAEEASLVVAACAEGYEALRAMRFGIPPEDGGRLEHLGGNEYRFTPAAAITDTVFNVTVEPDGTIQCRGLSTDEELNANREIVYDTSTCRLEANGEMTIGPTAGRPGWDRVRLDAQLEGRSFSASLTREPLIDTTRPVDNVAVTSYEAQPRAWERGTFGESDYECYNGDVYPGGLVPPFNGWRPIYGRERPQAEAPIAQMAANGASSEELGIALQYNQASDAFDLLAAGKPDENERAETKKFFDEYPDESPDPYEDCWEKDRRFSGAALAWWVVAALIVGCALDRYVLPYVHGLG